MMAEYKQLIFELLHLNLFLKISTNIYEYTLVKFKNRICFRLNKYY